ncbi:MAG TPA: hypothetical protein VMW75_06440, partial [Thermoanaerobaculia bacterium]|nr:hypothetical protein [Thermoanaerobaculia bacterium]
NAEWVLPFCFTFRPLDRLAQKLCRVPFLPLPAAPLALLFPWLWYFALPSRMVFVVGEAIDVRQMVADAGLGGADGLADLDERGRTVVRQVAEQVRRRCQIELEQQVGFHGRRPYDLRLLARELWQGRRKLARILPTGWPVTFNRHQRNRRRPPARGRLHALLRDWDLALFYLPLGWPLLSLARRLRRPPCGFRGVDPGARREIEGSFHWRLAERPLP